MARRWENRNSPAADVVRNLSRTAGISDILSTILINRGITDPEKAIRFLHPTLQHLPSPFLIEGMERAVDRIILALKKHEKIMLYGDYDVDGISSVSVVYLYMKSVGANVGYHIPSRLDEGYGLHVNSIKQFVSGGFSLLITLDCGISNNEEIRFAKQNNMDTIIADHHEIPDTRPPAYAILDPKDSSIAELSVIAGVGVAFNLLMALRSTMKKEGFFDHMEMPNLKHYLDLVALGTIADIVPLVGENRIFISAGIRVLQESERFGIKALKDISSLYGNELHASDVSFRIAPRINAAGRLDDPAIGVQLLTADNPLLAAKLASTLDKINTDRQQIEQKIFKSARELIKKDPAMQGSKGIVLASEEWHPGVIGIVASKLVEVYYRPTILISLDSGMGKGSARSIKPIHIYEALKTLSEYLVGFGGHKLAAGLLIKSENLEGFRSDFFRLLDATLTEDMLVPSLSIDAALSFREITKKFVHDLGLLMPYGPGNTEPVFISHDVRIADPVMLKNNVVRCKAVQDDSVMDLISFNAVESIESLPKYANIAYYIRNNVFNGSENIELVLKDIVNSRH
ncbi:MAG: single-stranded-DNA-specific exonuclease RecJ [Deltaproteobacteria bacterium]|nr:single-stranded-DNA-specific exonuclease RecJ [Deltaproteobacteria bacterium]MCL5277950.1 single-stranded-DNA-specific exonuclease RecJ [Deltaproteobacteria bacterium]